MTRLSSLSNSLGLHFGPEQSRQVQEHVGLAPAPIHRKPRQYYSTYRLPDYEHDSWRREMAPEDVERVQNECSGVMEALGYQRIWRTTCVCYIVFKRCNPLPETDFRRYFLFTIPHSYSKLSWTHIKYVYLSSSKYIAMKNSMSWFSTFKFQVLWGLRKDLSFQSFVFITAIVSAVSGVEFNA